MAYTELYVTPTGAGTHSGTSEANALSWAEMLAYTNLQDKRFNVKAGSYSRTTSTDTFTGTTQPIATNPCMIRGYNSSIGDLLDAGRDNSGFGELITTNFPAVTYTTGTLTWPAYTVVQNVKVTTALNGTGVTAGTADQFYQSRFENTDATGGAVRAMGGASVYCAAHDCDFVVQSSNSGAICAAFDRGYVNGCLALGQNNGGAWGFGFGTFGWAVRSRVINCLRGMAVASFDGYIGHCSFSNVAERCFYLLNALNVSIVNNVAWGTGAGSSQFMDVAGVKSVFISHNAVGNFVTADNEGSEWISRNKIALSASPFLSTTDLRLNHAAAGGALCRMADITGSLDLGAYQMKRGRIPRHPGMQGGLTA